MAKTQRSKQIRSLIEDSGYTRREATILVDAGFGEDQPRVVVCEECNEPNGHKCGCTREIDPIPYAITGESSYDRVHNASDETLRAVVNAVRIGDGELARRAKADCERELASRAYWRDIVRPVAAVHETILAEFSKEGVK